MMSRMELVLERRLHRAERQIEILEQKLDKIRREEQTLTRRIARNAAAIFAMR